MLSAAAPSLTRRHRWIQTGQVALLALGIAGCTTLPPRATRVTGPEIVGRVEAAELNEISGLAASRRHPGMYWVNNDSGDRPRLFVVRTDGSLVARVEIDGARAVDWEDIAAFDWHGEPWLLIADVGDNGAIRPTTTLYLLPEPVLDPAGDGTVLHATVHTRIALTYADGPRDCEGVAVDPVAGEILLISKRTEPPVLYRVPLAIGRDPSERALVARPVAPLAGIQPPTAAERSLPGRLGIYRAWVTAFDLSPDGRTAAVLTYGNLWLYHRAQGLTWAEALGTAPERIPITGLLQAEAVAFSTDGNQVLITTEAEHPPLQAYRLR